MQTAYVIYNTKSEYFFTRYGNFDKLGFKTYLFPTREAAEKYIQVAIREQIYILLEAIYEKSRLEIDITQEEYDSIKEHINMEVRPCFMHVEDCGGDYVKTGFNQV